MNDEAAPPPVACLIWRDCVRECGMRLQAWTAAQASSERLRLRSKRASDEMLHWVVAGDDILSELDRRREMCLECANMLSAGQEPEALLNDEVRYWVDAAALYDHAKTMHAEARIEHAAACPACSTAGSV